MVEPYYDLEADVMVSGGSRVWGVAPDVGTLQDRCVRGRPPGTGVGSERALGGDPDPGRRGTRDVGRGRTVSGQSWVGVGWVTDRSSDGVVGRTSPGSRVSTLLDSLFIRCAIG